MDLPDAGGIPLAAMTAWQALFDHGGLESGQTVLIQAASGGVGTFAVQLAHWKGATVYATVSKGRFGIIQELGADRPIDYESERFEEVAKDCDVVLDLLGGEIAKRSLACLKPGGILVSTVPRCSRGRGEGAGQTHRQRLDATLPRSTHEDRGACRRP